MMDKLLDPNAGKDLNHTTLNLQRIRNILKNSIRFEALSFSMAIRQVFLHFFPMGNFFGNFSQTFELK
jgi:hypothetical protein